MSVTFEYENRPDPFSEYRPGFEIRTRKRCTRIIVRTHAGQDLGFIRGPVGEESAIGRNSIIRMNTGLVIRHCSSIQHPSMRF